MTDIGPFQEIIEYRASDDNPEDFVDGEDALYRTDCEDPATEWNPGKPVDRSPDSGTVPVLCICKNPIFGGGYDCWGLLFRIPITGDWPDCVIGATSGAKISAGWPEAPQDWGGPAPKPFSTPKGFCTIQSWTEGYLSGSDYVIAKTWCENCQPGVGAPDDCCG